MPYVLKLAIFAGLMAAMSGCVSTAVGTIASNEDVQDVVIDGALDFLDF